uniref:Clarin 1 n=1 Tax=Dromaius novaehollandiae TaxID=8790 RepID=A0A8C4JLL5_DRONO
MACKKSPLNAGAKGNSRDKAAASFLKTIFPELLRAIPASIHVSVVLFCAAAAAAALAATGLFAYNALGSPRRALHGPAGLYLCTFVAGSCGCLVLVLFSSEVKVHHLSEKIANFKEGSFTFKTHSEQFDSAFWVVLACCLVQLLNAGLARVAGLQFPFSKPKDAGASAGAADLMY